MSGFKGSGACFPRFLIADYVALAFIDGALAVLAFWQLIRIHSRNTQLGLTRQKVFHLMIGFSNLGDCFYFVLTLIATCAGWPCWASSCGFIFMACPKILFIAAFLLILSFWVDLCHQADDEDDEEEYSSREVLLEKTANKSTSSNTCVHQECFPLPPVHVGNRQKIVILVTVLVFMLMLVFAVLIWIGMGKNPIDSATVARVYVDLFAVAIFLLGVALACYGLLIYLKMSRVRSERASSEMWKVTGLAVVSLGCFTTSALVALLTDIPLLYRWHRQHVSGVTATLLVILYYFIGSSVPSAFVLWVMRELPPTVAVHKPDESRIVTFITDRSPGSHNSQHWTAIASSQNQISRVSPI
ncbi:hypothetical protein Ancab_018301 [Ancistrocladus abbreviatus]